MDDINQTPLFGGPGRNGRAVFHSGLCDPRLCCPLLDAGPIRDKTPAARRKAATAFIGVFGAFNYGLHFFGGYLGGRFLSNRNLFVGGMALQVIGCGCISGGIDPLLYIGLALFFTGSGLNVTCINMMLTQRFKLGRRTTGRSVSLELRRHERRVPRWLRGCRLLPGDRELFEAVHFRDRSGTSRDPPGRVLLEDVDGSQHTAPRGDAETIPTTPARWCRYSFRPRPGCVGSCSSNPK